MESRLCHGIHHPYHSYGSDVSLSVDAMIKSIFPFAFVLRDLDNLVSLEAGCIYAKDEQEAFREVLSYANDMKLKDPKLRSVEIVQIGDPRPINDY